MYKTFFIALLLSLSITSLIAKTSEEFLKKYKYYYLVLDKYDSDERILTFTNGAKYLLGYERGFIPWKVRADDWKKGDKVIDEVLGVRDFLNIDYNNHVLTNLDRNSEQKEVQSINKEAMPSYKIVDIDNDVLHLDDGSAFEIAGPSADIRNWREKTHSLWKEGDRVDVASTDTYGGGLFAIWNKKLKDQPLFFTLEIPPNERAREN